MQCSKNENVIKLTTPSKNFVVQDFCVVFKVLLHLSLGLVMWLCSAARIEEILCDKVINGAALHCTLYKTISVVNRRRHL